jgi:AcrR family transcriptional regulator
MLEQKLTRPKPRAKSQTQPLKRGPQKRSRSTRKKILEAAIACLAELGYAATSSSIVQERAKVSRGSLFHQFPSKVELMLGVVDYVYEQDIEFYEQALAGLSRDARAVALVRAAWQAFSSPGGMAVLQVLIGSIGDCELRTRLPSAFSRVTTRSLQQMSKSGISRGTDHSASPDPEFLLVRAALRGLALEAAIAPSRELIEEAVSLLAEHHEHYLKRMTSVTRPKKVRRTYPSSRT